MRLLIATWNLHVKKQSTSVTVTAEIDYGASGSRRLD